MAGRYGVFFIPFSAGTLIARSDNESEGRTFESFRAHHFL